MVSDHTTLNCRGRLVSLSRPVIMGILNLTPDSFYDGGKWAALDSALRHTERMLREGPTQQLLALVADDHAVD